MSSIQIALISFAFLSNSSLTYANELPEKKRLSFDEWEGNKIAYQNKASGVWYCAQIANDKNKLVINFQEEEIVLYLSNKKISYVGKDIIKTSNNVEAKKNKRIGYDKVDGETINKEISFNYIVFDYDLSLLSYKYTLSDSDEYTNYQCLRRKNI
ncbi:TPA: hypothetical protein ACGFXX_003562 [Vibrio cholerae]